MNNFNNYPGINRQNGFGNYGSTPNPGYQRPFGEYQPPITTNVIYVMSLDEALIKTNSPNSDVIYFHQDNNEFYRIKVDAEGRKSYMIFTYTYPNQDNNTPATKADLQSLIKRIEALESNKKEVVDNGESNGQH